MFSQVIINVLIVSVQDVPLCTKFSSANNHPAACVDKSYKKMSVRPVLLFNTYFIFAKLLRIFWQHKLNFIFPVRGPWEHHNIAPSDIISDSNSINSQATCSIVLSVIVHLDSRYTIMYSNGVMCHC